MFSSKGMLFLFFAAVLFLVGQAAPAAGVGPRTRSSTLAHRRKAEAILKNWAYKAETTRIGFSGASTDMNEDFEGDDLPTYVPYEFSPFEQSDDPGIAQHRHPGVPRGVEEILLLNKDSVENVTSLAYEHFGDLVVLVTHLKQLASRLYKSYLGRKEYEFKGHEVTKLHELR